MESLRAMQLSAQGGAAGPLRSFGISGAFLATRTVPDAATMIGEC